MLDFRVVRSAHINTLATTDNHVAYESTTRKFARLGTGIVDSSIDQLVTNHSVNTDVSSVSDRLQCCRMFVRWYRYSRGFGLVKYLLGEHHILNIPNCVTGIAFYTLQLILGRSYQKIRWPQSAAVSLLDCIIIALQMQNTAVQNERPCEETQTKITFLLHVATVDAQPRSPRSLINSWQKMRSRFLMQLKGLASSEDFAWWSNVIGIGLTVFMQWQAQRTIFI